MPDKNEKIKSILEQVATVPSPEAQRKLQVEITNEPNLNKIPKAIEDKIKGVLKRNENKKVPKADEVPSTNRKGPR